MLLAVALALALASPPEPPSPDDVVDLVRRVEAQSAANVARLESASFTATTTSQELDDAGKPVHTAVKVERVQSGKGGSRTSSLVSCTVDGVAVTDPVAATQCALPGMSVDSGTGDSSDPFAPNEKDGWHFQRAGDRTSVKLTSTRGDPQLTGIARVDDGGVRSISLAPVTMPSGMQRLDLAFTYADVGVGATTSRAPESVTVVVKVGVLFVSKTVRTSIRYSDYKVP